MPVKRILNSLGLNKRADGQAFEPSIAFYRTIVDQTADCVYAREEAAPGLFVYVNDAMCRHLGYSREQLLTMSVAEIDTQFTPQDFGDLGARLVASSTPVMLHTMHRRSSGEIVPVQIKISRFLLGGRTLVLGAVRDVSDRINVEVALQASGERMELLAANVAEMLAVLDLNGRYTYVSPASVSVGGQSPSDLLGHLAQEFVHPDDWGSVQSGMHEALGQHGRCARTYRRKQSDGTYRWVETSMRPVMGKDGQPLELVISVRDISDRIRQGQQDVLRSQFFEQLVRRNRLDDILRLLVAFVECAHDGLMCMILLVEEGRAHPNLITSAQLPDSFRSVIETAWQDKTLGAISSSEFLQERNLVEDIDALPVQSVIRLACQQAGFRACWSEPIRGEGGVILGSISAYRTFCSQAGMEDIRTLEAAAEMASVAILRKRSDDELQLALSVYNVSKEGIMVTGPDNSIVQVNPSFTTITGYEIQDVLGKNPRILSSGRNTRAVYQDMWKSLSTKNHWQGEVLNRRKNGQEYNEWLTISVIRGPDGSAQRYVGMFADITEWKNAQDVIVRQANFDTLTGLPNRRLFRDRLEHEMKKMDRDRGQLALMFIDLDHFKEVNDTLGHDAGDQLLVEASKRMGSCVRASDTVARLGGDEFAVILAGVPNAQLAERVASEIIAMLEEPFHVKSEAAHVSASVGITFYPNDAEDAESLMKNADQAMYAAKSQGRDRFSWFTDSMQKEAEERLMLANDLREALAVGGLKVYYQPIVDLRTGRVVKAEALIRWHHPTLGEISPPRFIPIAEETGQINILGSWIFRQSAILAKKWVDWAHAQGDEELAKIIRISVNKSPKQFHAHTTFNNWVDILKPGFPI